MVTQMMVEGLLLMVENNLCRMSRLPQSPSVSRYLFVSLYLGANARKREGETLSRAFPIIDLIRPILYTFESGSDETNKYICLFRRGERLACCHP